jgi:uncharacterized protein (TIGR00106 family)
MKAIADVCVVPIGVGVSMSKYIVACEKVFREAGLNPHIHAYGTNVEGDWDEVMAAIKRCHERVFLTCIDSPHIRVGSKTGLCKSTNAIRTDNALNSTFLN